MTVTQVTRERWYADKLHVLSYRARDAVMWPVFHRCRNVLVAMEIESVRGAPRIKDSVLGGKSQYLEESA